MTKADEAKSVQSTILEKLSRIEDYLQKFNTQNDNISRLKARRNILESLRVEFEENQYELEKLDSKTEESKAQHRSVRINFENKYCDLMGEIIEIIEKSESSNSYQSSTSTLQTNQNNKECILNLPALNLKTFSGSYKDWTNFENCFKSVIDENKSLNYRQKLQYLKSCLREEALRAIESSSISDENYSKSWEILEKRFKNTRLIVQDHVMSILNAPLLLKSSPAALRELLDNVITNMAALKTLKIPVESWDALVIPIIAEKLDFNSKREWQTSLDTRVPTYEQFISFLEKRVTVLEALNSCGNSGNQNNTHSKSNQITKRTTTHLATTKPKRSSCSYCKSNEHMIHQCPEFINLSVQGRLEKVKLIKLCINCLRNNHFVENCRVTTKCRNCNKKHHSLLHVDTSSQQGNTTTLNNVSTHANHSTYSNQSNTVLLATAIVLIKNSKNQNQPRRIFLDPGSMSNCITKKACKELGLRSFKENFEIKGVNGTTSNTTQAVFINIKSRYNAYSAGNVKCIVVDKITESLPLVPLNPDDLEIPKDVQLADPHFYESSKVDVLIGGGLFWSLLCVGQFSLPTGLVFQKTHFGFIAGGPYCSKSNAHPAINRHNTSAINTAYCNLAVTAQDSMEERVAKFFEVEGGSTGFHDKQTLSDEEVKCEKHFKTTTIRDTKGRFIIKLPTKGNNINVGESKKLAMKRFFSLEKKFAKDENLKTAYSKFMHEYLALGHMQLTSNNPKTNTLYLPHHAVHKESSTTTKLRVVFDASATTANGTSLNDNLMRGPVIQRDLFSIILQFRTFRFALNADIAKMYRQIRVNDEDANYQLILWRDDPNKPLQTYKLLTLTYGTKPASFIATRCLAELATINEEKFPTACRVIKNNFYMDDLLTGADSIPELIQIRDQVINILKQGQFEIRKFHSNDDSILPNCEGNNSRGQVDLNKNEQTKILGLSWESKYDTLGYDFCLGNTPKRVTKRVILSLSSQIFDPLGLIGPVIMKAKIILQQLWSLKLGWDESVPLSIHSAWTTFLAELHNLKNIKIPRKTISDSLVISAELHGFSDASQQGYGAAVYLRVLNEFGAYEIKLMCARSRVAPLKTMTIPRLELCGALLLAQLMSKVRQNISIKIIREIFWTDSSIVLAWIHTPANSLNIFVGNRISEITALTKPTAWRHINSENNAADILSRGAYPSEIIQNSIWFSGPEFLKLPEDQWPRSHLNVNHDNVPEKKDPVIVCSAGTISEALLHQYSTFNKLQRVMAWILRFVNNCKNTNKIRNSNLSTKELNEALFGIIRIVQQVEFTGDWNNLNQNKALSNNSKILSLNPFMDENKLIRVGGRLKNSALDRDVKHPILLPKNSVVTKLLVRQEHERLLHAGPQATLASIRQRFWIISARSVIRQILHKCHPCFKINPTRPKFKMGDLPAPRVQPARPFLTSGVDYAGPILIKESRGRGKRLIKAYIVLFICFATKAVHIEIVSDLSKDEFLAALRRFMSRRGHPRDIHSDNGTNFIGAKNELREIAEFLRKHEGQISRELSNINVNWHLIPPKSPHMGGLWEANIKSMKKHLKKTVGNSHLTMNEMYTLLVRIEACLNSRPLIPLTNDPNDLQVLTPGHFLIGEPLTALPEYDLQEIPLNRLSRWQLVERLRNHYWTRWTREYLTTLQSRGKWFQNNNNPDLVGSMVVLVEDNLPPLSWRMGRICDVHPGDDGQIRVVSVKTTNGIVQRTVKKVCLLPTENISDAQ